MLCNDAYVLECANVPIKRFCITMRKEHKEAWKCQPYIHICKMPKTDNTTPARPQLLQQSVTPSLDDNNNLKQRKKHLSNKNISAVDETCLSILGGTVQECFIPYVMKNISTSQEQHLEAFKFLSETDSVILFAVASVNSGDYKSVTIATILKTDI